MRPLIWLRRVPVLGTLVFLANSYVYGGDTRADCELAPIKLWYGAFFWNVVASVVLVMLTLPDLSMSVWEYFVKGTPIIQKLSGSGASPGTTIISIFPSTLGLGIGIYALLFALDTSFIRQMHRKLEQAKKDGKRKHGSVLILNSDIAFPLSVLVVVLAGGALSQAYPGILWVQVVSWIGFWYAVVLVLEIIALLFSLIDNSILEKADDGEEKNTEVPSSPSAPPPEV